MSRRIRKIDVAFVSHGDADHMNALTEIFTQQAPSVRVNAVCTAGKDYADKHLEELVALAKKAGAAHLVLRQGQVWRVHDLQFTCLGPPAREAADDEVLPEPGNEASLVIRMQRSQFTMLFTGDCEGAGESCLIRSMEGESACTVLKVGHHGSKNSTTNALLEKTTPGLALISAGRNNLYGHPHEETVSRLRGVGARIMCTQESGAVTVRTDGEKMAVTPMFR